MISFEPPQGRVTDRSERAQACPGDVSALARSVHKAVVCSAPGCACRRRLQHRGESRPSAVTGPLSPCGHTACPKCNRARTLRGWRTYETRRENKKWRRQPLQFAIGAGLGAWRVGSTVLSLVIQQLTCPVALDLPPQRPDSALVVRLADIMTSEMLTKAFDRWRLKQQVETSSDRACWKVQGVDAR